MTSPNISTSPNIFKRDVDMLGDAEMFQFYFIFYFS